MVWAKYIFTPTITALTNVFEYLQTNAKQVLNYLDVLFLSMVNIIQNCKLINDFSTCNILYVNIYYFCSIILAKRYLFNVNL